MTSRSTTRRHARGFTLIEVLVALVVMAMMAVMAWRAVSALSGSREINERHLDSAETLQTLIRQWELDLREVQDSQLVTALSFDGATLRLTRRRDAGLQLVSWQLKEGRLTRWESPAVTTRDALQDAWFRSQQLSPQELRDLPGITGVIGWQMYFFRKNAWSNAQSSDDQETATSSSTSTGSSSTSGTTESATIRIVPTGVRMKIQFDEVSGYRGELTREAMVGSGQ